MRASVRRLAHTRLFRPMLHLYQRLRAKRELAAFGGRVVGRSYAGVSLTVAIRDSLGEAWYDHDWGPQPEFDFLSERGRLADGALVFNIGAHHGVVALIYAHRSQGGRVVAVEGGPFNAAVARENASLNPGLKVVVEHAAIAATSGTTWFSEGQSSVARPGSRLGRVRVSAVTIDELAERHGTPDVVTLDVEGYEGRALEGASRVLQAGRTDFFVEIHNAATLGPNGWTSREIAESLARRGADVWIAAAYEGDDPGAFTPLADASVDWAKRLYCIALFPRV